MPSRDEKRRQDYLQRKEDKKQEEKSKKELWELEETSKGRS